jgi:hypothetical protein
MASADEKPGTSSSAATRNAKREGCYSTGCNGYRVAWSTARIAMVCSTVQSFSLTFQLIWFTPILLKYTDMDAKKGMLLNIHFIADKNA